MGCDLVVALGPATVSGHTLFGQNCHQPPRQGLTLQRQPGRAFTAGETLKTHYLELPQARETCTVLGAQPAGAWGYQVGVNEHQLAAGCSGWRSRLAGGRPGLAGTDLVRLTLERGRTARQGVDVLTGLVERHGQSAGDHIFLLADPREAFVIEAAGAGWAYQEIHQARAVSDVAVIRQDWNRLARGLADRAIEGGWWPQDGSKLDFAGALSAGGEASALRRWGRATFLLEQQNGRIDGHFLRRLLGDHYEGTPYEVNPLRPSSQVTPLCQHAAAASGEVTAASFVTSLGAGPGQAWVVWYTFGPPCLCVHFPVTLDGPLPAAFSGDGSLFCPDSLCRRTQGLLDALGSDARAWALAREALGRLQGRFEQEAEEFVGEAAPLKRAGAREELGRLANSLMQHHAERFNEVCEQILTAISRRGERLEVAPRR